MSTDGNRVPPKRGGLDGVEVAETRLSHVDGDVGRLIIAGYDLEELVAGATFEDVCGLLWTGERPDAASRRRIRRSLAAARLRAFAEIPRLGDALDAGDGMDALRAAMAHLRVTSEDPDAAASVTGAAAVFAAAWLRRGAGLELLAPNPDLGHAADYLRMAVGAPASTAAAALETYFVTVAEDGMNASTFAARVVASTGSDVVSAVVAALGALKGPLHGGAPGPVLDMLDAIGGADRAAEWLESELRAGRRIIGMGHRVYRTRDPRAAVLENAMESLEIKSEGRRRSSRLALGRAVERAAETLLRARHPEKPLRANVEFYTALLLEAVGLPREAFTPTFAAARVAGWCAHVGEQRASGRLIRPGARYVGPVPAGQGPQSGGGSP